MHFMKMKKFLSFMLALVMLFSLMATAAFAEESYDGKTVIMYTGNVRGDLDMYAKIAAAKKAYEAAGADVILADAGNFMQGSAAVNTDRGLSAYHLMDSVGYDVAAMGLAEFGYADATTGYLYHGNYTRYHTQAQLQNGTQAETYKQNYSGTMTAVLAEKEAASFKTVSANVKATETASAVYAFAPSAIVTTKSGLQVGFYGVTDPSVAENVQDGFIDSISDPAAMTVTGADLTVCLSNAALSGDGYGDILIEAKTGGAAVAGAYLVDNKTKEVTKLDLSLDKTDADIAAQVNTIKAAAGKVVGKSDVILNGADSVGWNKETNLGDLVTDALAWYAKNYIDGIANTLPIVAIQNGGNCDNFIYTGDITETDLLKALPFSPMGVGVLVVTGSELLETLEAATQCESCPGFAQVSGIQYTLNTAKSFDAGKAYGKYYEADSIQRVTISSVNGQAFDPNAKYALVCDNFLLNGNDTYYTLKAAKEADGAVYINNGNGVKTRDIVAMYIERVLGGTIDKTYASAQGRITIKNTIDLPFTDIADTHWAYSYIGQVYQAGLMVGESDTVFAPNQTLSRAMLASILYRMANEPDVTDSSPFSDVPADQWYTNAVIWAEKNGIVAGCGDGTFQPDAPVTRAQVAVMLYGYAVFAGKDAAARADLSSFSDAGQIPSWALTEMQWANAEQLILGRDGKLLAPNDNTTRAEMASILSGYLGM